MKYYKLKERHKKPSSNSVPRTKPLSLKTGVFLFTGVSAIGITIGTIIATYIFFGIMTLLGLIAIIESNRFIKHIVVKSNKLLDVLIFLGTLYATLLLSVTITASLTIAGLGYTLVYAPWLRKRNN